MQDYVQIFIKSGTVFNGCRLLWRGKKTYLALDSLDSAGKTLVLWFCASTVKGVNNFPKWFGRLNEIMIRTRLGED
jgi:hypothetical protein